MKEGRNEGGEGDDDNASPLPFGIEGKGETEGMWRRKEKKKEGGEGEKEGRWRRWRRKVEKEGGEGRWRRKVEKDGRTDGRTDNRKDGRKSLSFQR